jgi:KaiC/GvpD/RAD55 family RecA-like ATPase
VRRILVTGVSGTGKSSTLAQLARRGFRTVDTDEPGWTGKMPKSSEERELILGHLREVEPLLRVTCTDEIDATLPLADVVERRVEIGHGSAS